jgi:hypothetical protein
VVILDEHSQRDASMLGHGDDAVKRSLMFSREQFAEAAKPRPVVKVSLRL